MPSPKWTHPDRQERQEHRTDSEQAFTEELDDTAATVMGDMQGDPRMIDEVWSHPDWLSWEVVMDHEVDTLQQAGTWEMVP